MPNIGLNHKSTDSEVYRDHYIMGLKKDSRAYKCNIKKFLLFIITNNGKEKYLSRLLLTSCLPHYML